VYVVQMPRFAGGETARTGRNYAEWAPYLESLSLNTIVNDPRQTASWPRSVSKETATMSSMLIGSSLAKCSPTCRKRAVRDWSSAASGRPIEKCLPLKPLVMNAS
jgi:hypothetical protein